MMLECQDPCPACKRPMSGIGWSVEPHECSSQNAMFCPHHEHWIGARPYCLKHGEPCQTPRASGLRCVLGKDHEDTFHLTSGGTQFTNSGKVGLGEMGSDYGPEALDV